MIEIPDPDLMRRAMEIGTFLPAFLRWPVGNTSSHAEALAESSRFAKLCVQLAKAQRSFETGVLAAAELTRKVTRIR